MQKNKKTINSPTNIELIKSNDLVTSLKNCTQLVINLYKYLSLTPKISDSIQDISGYCKNLQKMLKKLVQLLPKFTVPQTEYVELKNDFENLKNQIKLAVIEENKTVMQMKDIEKKLEESERREKKLLQQRKKDKKFTAQFQAKVEKIKKDSEETVKKFIEVSKEKGRNLSERKGSLPSINSYANRQKLSLMWLMDSPIKGATTERLAKHLIHQY